MLNIKKRLEQKPRKLKTCKTRLPKTARQMTKGQGEEEIWENTFLIPFSCGLEPYHHAKIKLKFKPQKSKNSRFAVEPKIQLKYLICHKQGPSLENMYTSL